jgi:hypothetical protein
VTTTSSTSAAASGSWATDEVAWIRATGAVEASWIEARLAQHRGAAVVGDHRQVRAAQQLRQPSDTV